MKIAILGLGTVGYGVFDLIKNNKNISGIEIVSVFDRHPSKSSIINQKIITNVDEVLNDDKIEVVVEVLGDGEFSYQCIKKAILNGKHVVTANKEVIANHLEELSLLKEQIGVSLYYDASVGGGIPIIHSLEEIVKTNDVKKIMGILNGTTNFILTKMQKEGMSMDEAIKLAQKLGFAESDPSADLDGLDMVRKIAILSMLAYKANININDVYHYSLTNISESDIDFINKSDYTLRYICHSQRNEDDVNIMVEPTLVMNDNLFANVNDENNMILVDTNINGPLTFYGKGAGRYPTANSIVNNLLRIKNRLDNPTYKSINKMNILKQREELRYYLHVKDINSVNKEIIEKQNGAHIITKKINSKTFEENMENVKFYACVLD